MHLPEIPRRDDWAESRDLGLETLDVYFLHNPEGPLAAVGRTEFLRRVRQVFELLERKVADGVMGVYGTATWNGYRVRPDNKDYLSLQELVDLAAQVGGPNDHFKVIQLPYSLAMPEAFTIPNQKVTGEDQPHDARGGALLGIAVWASASLLQGRLTTGLPDMVAGAMEGRTTPSDRFSSFGQRPASMYRWSGSNQPIMPPRTWRRKAPSGRMGIVHEAFRESGLAATFRPPALRKAPALHADKRRAGNMVAAG